MSSYSNLTAAQLLAKIKSEPDLILLDVREPWEYEEGHIPGALLVPLGELVQFPASRLEPRRPVVCICAHGIRSAHAAQYLAGKGCASVSHLIGGMAEWDGEIETGWGAEP